MRDLLMKKLLILLMLSGCSTFAVSTGDVEFEADAGSYDAAPDAEPDVCAIPEAGTGVYTLTGSPCSGFANGPRGVARFNNPVNVAYYEGLLYIADRDNDAIRVATMTGDVTTLYRWDSKMRPFGLLPSPKGLYVETDHGGNPGLLWLLDWDTGEPRLVSSFVGRPRGMAHGPNGSIVMTDYLRHIVNVLEADGSVRILAGNRNHPGYADGVGDEALFHEPYDIEPYEGDYLVLDKWNSAVRRVSLDGQVTTHITSTDLYRPQSFGGFYIGDTSQIYRIGDDRLEFVGGSVYGYKDAEDPTEAEFASMEGMDFADGKLFIADGHGGEDGEPYHTIRVMEF